MKKVSKNTGIYTKKYGMVAFMAVLSVMIIMAGILHNHDRKEKKNVQETVEIPVSAMEQLSKDEQTIAVMYAEMYGVSKDEVAEMKLENGAWDNVYTKLEEAYFTIGETDKYQMAEEGYLLEDLYEAEVLARKTGRKAIELAKAKGKADEKKSWQEVFAQENVREKSIEEKLGLTVKQIKKLKKKNFTEDERIDIAILCLNRKETFEDVMKELESGKTTRDLKEETEYGE